MKKKYTVEEIDDLRIVISDKYLYGTYKGSTGNLSITYNASEKTIHVEEQVRTHMLAGHTAKDLLLSEK